MRRLRALDPLLGHELASAGNDEFGLAAKIMCLVKDEIEPPYSISINGGWGCGKTTLLRMVQRGLEADSYPVLWFNPWEYSRAGDVVMSLLQHVTLRFFSGFPKEELGIFAISLFTSGVDLLARVLTRDALSYENVQKIVEQTDNELGNRYRHKVDLIQQMQRDFADLTGKTFLKFGNKPLVIILDDLDRCLPDDALNLLEALKNYFIVPQAKVIFLAALDTSIAKQFIAGRYKDIGSEYAISYFKKVFHLSIDLPPFSRGSADLLIHDYLSELVGTDLATDPRLRSVKELVKTLIVRAGGGSYRDLINVLTAFYVIAESPVAAVPDGTILSVLVLKEKWHDFYELITTEARKEMGRNLNQLLNSDVIQHYVITRPALEAYIELVRPSDIPLEVIARYGLL